MFSAKSNEQVEKYREEGDNFLKQLKVYEALVAYNKSICFAEPGSLEISLTFERRSEVFFNVAQYEKCLSNINAAREHGYPSDKIVYLNEREEKCKILLKEATRDNVLIDYPKLTYPPNEKIPFIVDSLQLREDKDFGRYVITTNNLIPGDVIAIEETFMNFISPNAVHTRCFNCLKSNMLDLFPSSASVMFCSSKCCAESYKKFNGKDELIRDSLCGNDIRQKMLRIMSQSLDAAGGFNELQQLAGSLNGKNLFDFDFRDSSEVKKNLLVCVAAFLPKTDSRLSDYLSSILSIPDGEKKNFFVTFASQIILNYMRNGVKVPAKGSNLPDGGLLLPFVALINHSCDPNVYASFVDNKCFFTVLKPIEADEQIFVNYRKGFMEQPREQRQAELLKSYEFNCECLACVNNYPMPNKLRRIDKSFKLPSFGRFGSNQALLDELKGNNEFLSDIIQHHPCFETAAILMRNKELIRTVSERASFPFDFISK